MRKLQEIEGPSCLTAAEDDEPLFVLRANDPLAPNLVRDWAKQYFETKLRGAKEDKRQHKKLVDAYMDAYMIANDMESWKKNHPDPKR